MKRKDHIRERLDLQETDQGYLDQTHSAVKDKYQRHQKEDERMSALHCEQCQKKAYGPGARIPHQDFTRIPVEDQISCKHG